MAKRYSIYTINTTDGKRYIILRDGRVSLANRTYYKKKSNAQKRANVLNNM